MNTAASLEAKDTPLAAAQMCVHLFSIHFCELWETPRPRRVLRPYYARACAYLRGAEAIVRRVLMTLALAILPDLPPAGPPRPKASAPTAPKPESEDKGEGEGDVQPKSRTYSFKLMPPVVPEYPPAAMIGSPPAKPRAKPYPYVMADVGPLAGRFNALVGVLQAPAAAARRLAFRVRSLQARGKELYFDAGPLLHSDHELFLGRPLMQSTEDANELLRLQPKRDSS